MSLSTALHSALSGLTAAGRASGVVSENIANALTPGYARRSIELEAHSEISPGVRVAGITRHADAGIAANRRATDAELGAAETLDGFYTRLTGALGGPAENPSLATRLADFDGSLMAAASRPDSVTRLDAVAQKAGDLARALTAASDTVQSLRSEADRKISVQVGRLNEALANVQELNSRITAVRAGGAGTAALLDQRQLLVDEINQITPVNVVSRDHGQIALYTDAGAILLDGRAAELGFTRTNTIVAEMSVQGSALSGLEINGVPVRTDSVGGVLRGGSLSAQFQIRDELAVSAQAELDAAARDLIERFEAPGLDPTLVAGSPGLFTDNGAAFDATLETGLAGRLSLNAAADPAQGGGSWRLRDGLGAATPGAPGDARFLQALQGPLETGRTPATGNFGSGQLTASGVSATLLSNLAQSAAVSSRRLSFAAASQSEMKQIELTQGVDTDAELGRLMLIEQAYAANARMFEVVDEMMQTLLRL